MTKNISAAMATVNVDTNGDSERACEVILRKIYNSRYASSFVLRGDVLLYAMLGAKARRPAILEMVSRVPMQEADEVFASLCDNSAGDYPLSVELEFGDPVVPHPVMLDASGIWGEDFPQIPSMGVEALLAYALQKLMEDPLNPDNSKHLYDVVALAMTYECDGRILYEAIAETFERNGTDVTRYPEAFELDEKICNKYNSIIAEDDLCAPSYIKANEIMNELLWPVYISLLSENEFFGRWDPKGLVWRAYEACDE